MTTSTGETTTNLAEEPTRGTIPADTFALRLMAVRMHAGGLTIQDAAAKAGVTNQSWSNWERGMVPRDKADIVRAIADTFGIDRTWLMWGGALAPEPRRRARGGPITTRPKGLSFRHPSGDSDITCRSVGVREPATRRRPADHRPPGRPDEFSRPVRLTGPIA